MDYITAKSLLIQGNPVIYDFFKTNSYTLEYAYCLILSKYLLEAESELEKISFYDIRADWAKKMINILKDEPLPNPPTFLQVRNFLEIDLTLLIKSNNIDYANKLMSYGNLFQTICQESYKSIGRSLFYTNHDKLAINYFNLAKNSFYKDGELHFLIGKYYLKHAKKTECIKALKTCLKLTPEYKPAQDILNSLHNI